MSNIVNCVHHVCHKECKSALVMSNIVNCVCIMCALDTMCALLDRV